MDEFEQAAEEAAKETDEALLSDLEKIKTTDAETLESLVPAPDRRHVRELVEAVRRSTDANAFRTAFRNFVGKASEVAVRALRKAALG